MILLISGLKVIYVWFNMILSTCMLTVMCDFMWYLLLCCFIVLVCYFPCYEVEMWNSYC